MKKLFVATLLVCGMGVFANPHESKPGKEKEKNLKSSTEATISRVCCRRTASDSTTGQSATIEACATVYGDPAVAMGIACATAYDTAHQAVNHLVKNFN